MSESRSTTPLPWIALAIIAAGIGIAISLAPWLTVLALGVLSLTALLAPAVTALLFWQFLAFAMLTGYAALNYGFANWAFHIGSIPFPVGHLLAFTALFLAAQRRIRDVKAFFREPIALGWLVLLGLTFGHLIFDIPRFGGYAIRDASFVIEGGFLLLGFLWAKRPDGIQSFAKVLVLLFLITLTYSLTYPIGVLLREHSPISGIFLRVPVVGFYKNISLFLVTGAVYYYLVARHVINWPSIALLVLALLQIGWSLVFQARSMYVGIIVAMLILVLFTGVRKGVKIAGGLTVGIIALLVIISVSGIQLKGRIGPLEPSFIIQHFQSVFLVPDTPAVGSAIWRLKLLPEVLERWMASTATMLIGEGFGEPLIEFYTPEGVPVRQPHNTHLTILVRLGLAGMTVWLFINWRIFSLFMRALRRYQRGTSHHVLILWLFIFYVLGMLMTTVQPWLEFSYGAIPFFTLLGFALSLMQSGKKSPILMGVSNASK